MVLSAIVDISDRKRLEERFRRVVESAPNAMVMIGPVGQIEMVNAQTENLFGYAREEMLGQSIEMLVPERFRRHHPGLRNSFFRIRTRARWARAATSTACARTAASLPSKSASIRSRRTKARMVLSAIVDISDRKGKGHPAGGDPPPRQEQPADRSSLLDLQSQYLGCRSVGLMRESQNRVRSMALTADIGHCVVDATGFKEHCR